MSLTAPSTSFGALPTDVPVLAAYLAPHLAGARVLYVGDLDDATPLFEAGARLVHVYRFTPESQPLSGAVLVRSLQRGLDLPAAGFDVAIVEDLGRVAGRLDLLAALRTALGTRGIGALVARTGEGIDTVEYTQFYDACATRFEHVKMVGRVPFYGTLLCELGVEGAPDVTVDTELAPPEPPTTLVALVGQQPFDSDEYAIFAHPQPALPVIDRAPVAALAKDLEAAVAASATAREEALELRNALAAAIAQQADASAEDELDKALAELAVQSERAEESEARVQQLATQAQHADTRAQHSDSRAQQHEARAKRAEAKLAELEQQLRTLRQEHAAHAEGVERAAAGRTREAAALAAVEEHHAAAVAAITERAERAERRVSEIQGRAAASELRVEERDTEIELRDAKLRELESRLTTFGTELETSFAQRSASERELETRRAELQASQAELVELRARPVAVVADDSGQGAELAALEASLRERGALVLELQAELARRERMVTQLLLGERFADGSSASADLERKLDELAREVALRHGELEARGWRIEELETALAAVAKTPDSLL